MDEHLELVIQHLAGKHNQKRHAWRYGSTKDARQSMKDRPKGEREEYKRRARAKGKKQQKPKTVVTGGMGDFEKSIANADIEHAGIFDSDGKLLFKVSGDQSEVTFSEDQLKQMKGAIVTHNHPNKVGNEVFPDGGSFSPSDVELMANRGPSEIRAITKNYIYSMKPKIVHGNNLSRGALNFVNQNKPKVQKKLDKLFHAGKINNKEFAVEFWHEMWTDAANAGFVIYERKKR